MRKLRTVIELESFSKQKDLINKDVRYMDQILNGVIWTLSHSPTVGQETDVKEIWAIATNPPPLIVYYSFNEEQVDLIWVQQTKEQGTMHYEEARRIATDGLYGDSKKIASSD